MVTHDPQVAQHAERVVTLSDGIILSDKSNGHKLVKPMLELVNESH